MARPISTIKGFIEIEWEGTLTLLSVDNIAAISQNGGRTVIALKNPIDNFGTKIGIINAPYEHISFLLREATR